MNKVIAHAILFLLSHATNMHSSSTTLEKPMVIIIPSYNNKDWYKRNLNSLFSQKYQNYRVIYINDCSTDGTGELVEQYIKKKGKEDRVTLIHNTTRKRQLANHYKAAHMCNDDEIIVHLDGDDWLAHEQVLSYINKVYDNPNIWLTYGQRMNWPTNIRGSSHAFPLSTIKNNEFREYKWCVGHLRTFYAWLFKLIKLEDFMCEKVQGYEGEFFPAGADNALLYPMLEMAHNRFTFIPDILYIRNIANTINVFKTHKDIQSNSRKDILQRKKYLPLKNPCINRLSKAENSEADMLIFSSTNQVSSFLESAHTLINGLKSIYIITHIHNQDLDKSVHNAYADITYIDAFQNKSNVKQSILTFLNTSTSNYILIAQDTISIQESIDLKSCIRLLEQTFAYGFYLSLGEDNKQQLPPHVTLNDDLCAWKFKFGKGIWQCTHNPAMTLYRKSDFINQLNKIDGSTMQELLDTWQQIAVNSGNIGLFYKQAKAKTIH